MRRFQDERGRRWDVVAGRESWGAIVAIFIPTGDDDEGLRQAALQAASYEEANLELGDLDEGRLRALLARSHPKTMNQEEP